MPYSDYSLRDIERRLQVTIEDHADLYEAAPEVEPSDLLRQVLRDYLPLALAINTEKARSEMLIAPILVEVRRQLGERVSLFSGVDFPVDPALGLNGVCDFILSGSPQQQFIEAPVVTIIEAKNENLKSGYGQCIAAMLGARLFNEREGNTVQTVFGAVTSGTLWRFMQLNANTVTLDQREYHIDRLPKILGILVHLLSAAAERELSPV